MKDKKNKNEGILICGDCGDKENFTDKIKDRIDYIVTEKERVCDNCGFTIDYWAYGYWSYNIN